MWSHAPDSRRFGCIPHSCVAPEKAVTCVLVKSRHVNAGRGFNLLAGLAWRLLSASPGLALLNVLGVAVGISVVLAIQLANLSALAAFRSTLDVVAGKSNLEITADGARFDERVFRDVRLMDGVVHASPALEAVLMTPDHPGQYLRLTGLDPFSHRPFLNFEFSSDDAPHDMGLDEQKPGRAMDWLKDPDGVAITSELGKKLGLAPGAKLEVFVDGRRRTLRVRDWIRFDRDHMGADEHLAVMDIAAAQELLGAEGKLDRIQLIVRGKPADLIPALEKLVPPDACVALPVRRGSQIANMLGAFQLNLMAMSLIALLVAGYLLHTTMTTFVVRQRRSIGILRAMGFTPGQVQRVVLLEALLVGSVGIVLGISGGMLLARWSLDSMNTAISSLYLLVHVERLSVDAWTLWMIGGLGWIATLAAAWRPAREAANIPPTDALSFAQPSHWVGSRRGNFSKLGWLCLGCGALAVHGALHSEWHWLGFVAGLLWMLALSCWIPSWTFVAEKILLKILPANGRMAPVHLGLKNLTSSLHRSTIAVAAFMTAFSMMLGTSVMIDSFRSTVDYWVNQTVRADVYLTTASNLALNSGEALPAQSAKEIPAIKGVMDVDTYHEIWVDAPDSPGGLSHKIKLACIDFAVLQRHQHLAFKGMMPKDFVSMRQSNGVLVNESFSTHYGKREGDVIMLRTPSGKTEFKIEGVFYDYSTDSGLVLMDHALYAQLWKDPKIYSYAIYLDGTRTPAEVKAEIEKRFGQESRLAIFLNRELHDEVLRVFDQTFAITMSLRAVAVAVAALAVFLTLATLIAERGREMAIVRALGMGRMGVLGMTLTEASLLGALGWFMGCVGGLGLSWLLAFVINKAYFGWSIQWRLDPSILATAFVLALPAALLAGLLSGFRAIKTPVIEALRHE